MNRFEIFVGKDKQYYWRLVAANGEIVAQSEGYTRATDARRSVLRLKEVITDATVKE